MSEMHEALNWSKEQLLYVQTFEFLDQGGDDIKPPRFDWRDHHESDIVRSAMRDYFGEGLTSEKQQRFQRLNLALNPQSHHQASQFAEEEINKTTYNSQGTQTRGIAPMSSSKAACIRENPNHFFYDGKPTLKQKSIVRAAKKVCENCVMKDECLDWGRKYHRIAFAIHGGELLGPDGQIFPEDDSNIVTTQSRRSRRKS